jgi:GNAT superfamily N-acetyltransferase
MAAVRAATERDAEAIVQLTAWGWRAAYPGMVPDRMIENLPFAAWRHDIRSGLRAPVADAFTHLAEVDGTAAGYCYVAAPGRGEPEDSRVAELVAIYVHPERWRSGIGRALAESAMGVAERLGYRQLRLWTFEPNAPARAFYRALGWSDDGARQPHPASGTPLVGMRRELRPSQ